MTHFAGEGSQYLMSRHAQTIREAILEMGDEILAGAEDDLVNQLVAFYRFDVPVLRGHDAVIVEQGETRLHSGKGVRVVFAIPFSGQEGLFTIRSSSHVLVPYEGVVRNGELRITVETDNPTPEVIQGAMRNQLGHYEDELAVLRRDFDGFNREMPDTVAGLVRQRRQELERNRNVLSSLPFPVRKREDAVIPVPVKRVLRLPKPADKAQGQFEREHELPDGDYEEILAATRSMGWVMERAPNTFTGLHEEGIRDFFLALLNVGFRGAAMAEVFNGRGRTDILIRVGDRNVFIAECKVWESADKLKEGIDQLLSYAGWRDTKCAILLFVRQRNVTAIVETAEKVFSPTSAMSGKSLQLAKRSVATYSTGPVTKEDC